MDRYIESADFWHSVLEWSGVEYIHGSVHVPESHDILRDIYRGSTALAEDSHLYESAFRELANI